MFGHGQVRMAVHVNQWSVQLLFFQQSASVRGGGFLAVTSIVGRAVSHRISSLSGHACWNSGSKVCLSQSVNASSLLVDPSFHGRFCISLVVAGVSQQSQICMIFSIYGHPWVCLAMHGLISSCLQLFMVVIGQLSMVSFRFALDPQWSQACLVLNI